MEIVVPILLILGAGVILVWLNFKRDSKVEDSEQIITMDERWPL